jgi:DNA-binding SARP family transcriptional activator
MELRLNLFGRFQLMREQRPVALPTRKSESLFAFLALRPGHHCRARLAEMFWPDAEPAVAPHASTATGAPPPRHPFSLA